MITFNGRHASDFNIKVKPGNRQLLPGNRDNYQYAIDRSGSVLFDDELDDRFIENEMKVYANDNQDLRVLARQIANWLHTRERKRLTFDDEPDKFYMAKVESAIDLEDIAGIGQFTVVFRCEPYAYSNEESITFDITDDTENTVSVSGNSPTPPEFFLVNNGNTINGFTIKLESEI